MDNWSARDISFPDTTVVSMVEQQIARTPDAIAVVCDSGCLSYGELGRRAHRLAGVLANHGVGPERVVGVEVERSLALPEALLAVWLAGGVYLPLDPAYPPARLMLMADRAAVACLIASDPREPWPRRDRDAARADVVEPAYVLHRPDSLTLEALDEEEIESEPRPVHRENGACLFYTSGSTGTPKGVVVTHGGLLNTLRAMQTAWGWDAHDVVAVLDSISVDFSLVELVTPWLIGGACRLVPREAVEDPARLAERVWTR